MNRRDSLRLRWHNASLKTSFMVYMLGFLLLALVLSTFTASIFGEMQNNAVADAYEVSGLYLYDKSHDALVPAREVDIDEDGGGVFVQTVRDNMTALPLSEVSSLAEITDASDYQYTMAALLGSSGSRDENELRIEVPEQTELTIEDLPAYDAQARERFDTWLASHPDSPYASFFAGSDQGASLPASAIGYYLSTPPSESARALSTLLGLLMFLMFPLWFGICIFIAARRFFRKRLEPGFEVLDRAAANIAEQNLEFSVTYERDDELGHLASSFETMRTSLAESQRVLWRTAEERKRLNAAFAHDLRTPLTILKGKIELLEAHVHAGDLSAERLASSIASLTTQIGRLERYVAAMSGLQKLEDRAIVVHTAAFDSMASMIEDAGTELAARANRAFALSLSPRCDRERPALCIDQAIVGEVVENLLSNALRYATSQVDARMDVQNGALVVMVEDDGPGFSHAALERGCAPFFSEAPSSEHFGLGLNIASLLCEKHGGNLTLENRESGGARTVARFSLNICPEA